MKWLGVVAMGVWAVTAAVVIWFFVHGVTEPGADGRTKVLLAPTERDLILGEMRQLLIGVDGIVGGLGDPDPTARQARVAKAARSVGMGMAADVEPGLMAKLPLAFKQMGISVHKDFDAMADAAERGADPADLLRSLASITNRCTVCHALYQLPAAPAR
ncbi:MAG: hypothetical protein U0172_11865 [Nitrospiraceae bacterium]